MTDDLAQALQHAEHERRRSRHAEAVLRDGIETLPEGFAVYDDEDRLILCNESYRHLFPSRPDRVVIGARFEDMLRGGLADGGCAEAAGREEEWIAARVQDHRHPGGTIEQHLADGRWVRVSSQRLSDGCVADLRIDITSLNAADLALRKSEERFRLVVESVPNAIIMSNAAGRIEMVNAQAERSFGYARDELVGQPLEILLPERYRSGHPGLRAAFAADPQVRRMGARRDLSALRKDGSEFPVEIGLSPIETDAGPMVLSTIIDITRRKEAERTLFDANKRTEQTLAALSQSEERLSRAQRLAHMGSFVTNLQTGAAEVTEETYRIFGVTRETADFSLSNFISMVHPDDRAIIAAGREQGRRGECPEPAEFRILRPDGSVRQIYNENELIRDDKGEPTYLAGTLHDVTERHQVEAQLRQAQKMEAIGNLTGGMAHDFNNILGVIIGNLDLARKGVGGDRDLEEILGDALNAAWRGADLTRRLLAFARRQPLRPARVNINELIADTMRLLQRLLTEDIDVSLDLGTDIWPVTVDPAQLESSLANLATNARDAMPKGGRLIISTANRELDAEYAAAHAEARAGDFVMIAVSDTGTGMPAEVASKIFEPFFTTKEPGKGTGLGLSMVFGFLRQSGGHVSVYSEPGIGTTFRLYFPRATGESSPREVPASRAVERGSGETILVVEDNPAVRRVVLRQLREFGYRALECERAADALDTLSREHADLLFTDIVMPGGLDGVALARIALERWPKLKVVLTSGFPQSRIDGYGEDVKKLRLLSKPYSSQELAAVLHAALGE